MKISTEAMKCQFLLKGESMGIYDNEQIPLKYKEKQHQLKDTISGISGLCCTVLCVYILTLDVQLSLIHKADKSTVHHPESTFLNKLTNRLN